MFVPCLGGHFAKNPPRITITRGAFQWNIPLYKWQMKAVDVLCGKMSSQKSLLPEGNILAKCPLELVKHPLEMLCTEMGHFVKHPLEALNAPKNRCVYAWHFGTTPPRMCPGSILLILGDILTNASTRIGETTLDLCCRSVTKCCLALFSSDKSEHWQ